MFCPKCGAEIADDAVICPKCGRQVVPAAQLTATNDANESKTGIGVLMGLFLGLIGLIIGVCIYPTGTVARKSFMKGWLVTFFVCFGISLICMIIVLACIPSTY